MQPVEMGVSDRVNGVPLEDNPFTNGTDSWTMWRRGWLVSSTSGRMLKAMDKIAGGDSTPTSSRIVG